MSQEKTAYAEDTDIDTHLDELPSEAAVEETV